MEPVKQMKVTQEMRQEAYDNKETTDDHGMHVTGMMKDQNGTIYYKVKNSWGTGWGEDGFIRLDRSVNGGNICNICQYGFYP